MRLNQDVAVPSDLLTHGDGRTLDHLWFCDDFKQIIHVRRLEEIDLH